MQGAISHRARFVADIPPNRALWNWWQDAPYSALRIELWDEDSTNEHDAIGSGLLRLPDSIFAKYRVTNVARAWRGVSPRQPARLGVATPPQ